MIPLTGYTDRLSAAPGERIAFKVSSEARGPYRASLARVIHANPNAAEPGVKVEDLAHRFSIERPSRVQPIALGSYARVDAAASLSLAGSLTVSALVWPTLAAAGEQCVISRWRQEDGAGWALSVGKGGVAARVGAPGGAGIVLDAGRPLELRRWYRIWLTVDTTEGSLRAGHVALDGRAGGEPHEVSISLPAAARLHAAAPILIGARLAPEPREHWNGKIEDPLILSLAARAPEAFALDPLLLPTGLVAAWDFSRGIDGLDVTDIGPHRLGGRLVNLPTRAVTGARWSGNEMCWRHAPREYAAIHFHEDDIHDAGWETDFELTVPADLVERHLSDAIVRGRVCRRAALLRAAAPRTARRRGAPHRLDLHVSGLRQSRPRQHRRALPRAGDGVGRVPAQSRRPSRVRALHLQPPPRRQRHLLLLALAPRAHPAAALSHLPRRARLRSPPRLGGHASGRLALPSRGSPSTSSPTRTWTPKARPSSRRTPPCSPARIPSTTPSAPTMRTRPTSRGAAGSSTWAAMASTGASRRVPRCPACSRCVRAETGIRAWEARVGEYYHALDGAYGGLWRRNGRPPQQLVGVGFSAQGLFEGSYYRRAPGADDPRAAWILEGVKDEVIGDFGLSGGGAAGFELDRADAALGTPPGAIVIASSEGHGPSFVVVFEELLSHLSSATGERPSRMIRGDMIYAELPGGGAIFAVGSITFCGSLSHHGYDNNVSRIPRNVIDRFRAPR